MSDPIQKSREARSMLDSALFQEARASLESQLAQMRRDVPISSTELHTRIILMGQLADKFFGFFEQLAQTGQLAEMQLIERQKQQSMLEQGLAIFRRGGRGTL